MREWSSLRGSPFRGGSEHVSGGTTGPDGAYRLTGPDIAECEVSVEAYLSGYVRAHRRVRAAPEAGVDFELLTEARIIGRVTFSDLVPDRIDLETNGGDGDRRLAATWDPLRRRWRATVTPGEYELWISAPGYAPLSAGRFKARAGAAVAAPAAHLTPGGIVEGVVQDQRGITRAGCEVSIRYGEHRVLMAETNGEGLFRIAHVPPGRYPITTRVRRGVTLHGEVSVKDGAVTWIELRPE